MSTPTKLILSWLVALLLVCLALLYSQHMRQEHTRRLLEAGYEEQIGGWQRVRGWP